MRGIILGMLAETSAHPGMGQMVGAVDLPVARERTTGYPMIPSTALKGALRDKRNQELLSSVPKDEREKELNEIFGSPGGAGGVIVTDARLLLLPVRSLTGVYLWVTCPLILERFRRDFALLGQSVQWDLPSLEREEAWVATVSEPEEHLFLEELSFKCRSFDEVSFNVSPLIADIKALIKHEFVGERLEEQLVIVHNKMFAYLAQYSLPIQARNQLDEETKESKNLWYEETLPPDTLLYCLIMGRADQKGALRKIIDSLLTNPYVQVGGNETVGQGWFISKVIEVEEK